MGVSDTYSLGKKGSSSSSLGLKQASVPIRIASFGSAAKSSPSLPKITPPIKHVPVTISKYVLSPAPITEALFFGLQLP
ncbi:hypothetical protein LINPERPRIM_LOCUS2338, partial [Linum perenne]